MQSTNEWQTHPEDIVILRDLLKRKRELAQDPVMQTRRELWTRLVSLEPVRPMILAETMGVLDELVPLASLRCQAEWARTMERSLRELIFRVEQVRDDWVVEPWIEYGWFITPGSYGVETVLVRGYNEGKLASYHWDAPIQDLDRDFDKLHIRSLEVDREKTASWKAFLGEHFGDILPVRLRASYWWTTGMTWEAINLIGLEGLMLTMYDNPAGLHRLMGLLQQDFLNLMDWFEKEELLTLNNENDYIGSGSIGYTKELPRNGAGEGEAVKIKDLWGLSESQETVGVSPRLFEEFIFPYQQPVTERFGLSYYGCCEPVHTRIRIIKQLKNLRRVSVSPWCDQEKMADELRDKIIFCRKPNPAIISTETWDEEAIREDIRSTLHATKGCRLEFAMKDVHTLNNQPWRLGRWAQIAREESER
jgi:hypothetical protein